jgi:outer membrane lipoprotein-sorting protein
MTRSLRTPHDPRAASRVPRRRTGILAALALLAVASLSTALAAQESADADAILDAIYANLRGTSQAATLEMTIVRPDGEDRYELRMFSEGEERALTRVVAPAREAGQAFLTVEDNVFLYNPRLRRVLRLPPSGRSDAFLGSDISYDDLAGDQLRDQYTATILERTDDRVTLELIPDSDAPTPYGKVELTAELPTYAPRRIVYFDQRGNAVRENLLSDYAEVDGRYVPQRFEVRDLLDDGNRTVVEFRDARFGVDIPDACFQQNALEREGACEP